MKWWLQRSTGKYFCAKDALQHFFFILFWVKRHEKIANRKMNVYSCFINKATAVWKLFNVLFSILAKMWQTILTISSSLEKKILSISSNRSKRLRSVTQHCLHNPSITATCSTSWNQLKSMSFFSLEKTPCQEVTAPPHRCHSLSASGWNLSDCWN